MFQATEAMAGVAEAGCSLAPAGGSWQHLGSPVPPQQGSACLPHTPGSLRATAHYSLCFKNKQAKKKPTVKICKSFPTNFQHLLGGC